MAFMASAGVAHSTVGGPLTVEMLGMDHATDRIYLRQDGHDGSGDRDCVFYFDLRAEHPERAQVSAASRERWDQDSTVMARCKKERQQLERFLTRLSPLERTDEGRPALVRSSMVTADTVVAGEGYPTPRFQLDIANLWNGVSDPVSIRATAYFQASISCVRRYRIPGGRSEIAILSFMGDPFEGGYETQRAALIGVARIGFQRLEGPHGVLP